MGFDSKHKQPIITYLKYNTKTSTDLENVMNERDKLRKALAFIAADTKLSVDHLRGYADGVLKGLEAPKEPHAHR
jgi:hypothetical protein